ncbi:hypothetical protein OUZ56_009528 [Daphnia magna]|uniref:Uncharacterized protein n=1 Tax=Daphnia magna TaxID=35525 RepID=A0ABR0AG81_9CRUS|nr:hypothetical protein OUZ56_009528 [Daphnia magna]
MRLPHIYKKISKKLATIQKRKKKKGKFQSKPDGASRPGTVYRPPSQELGWISSASTDAEATDVSSESDVPNATEDAAGFCSSSRVASTVGAEERTLFAIK